MHGIVSIKIANLLVAPAADPALQLLLRLTERER
jgi:hypothetical protein